MKSTSSFPLLRGMMFAGLILPALVILTGCLPPPSGVGANSTAPNQTTPAIPPPGDVVIVPPSTDTPQTGNVADTGDSGAADSGDSASADATAGNSTDTPDTSVAEETVKIDPLDWPNWRGPGQDGVSMETGLIDEFDPAGGPGSNVAWKRDDINGPSSPIVMRGKLYMLCRDKIAPKTPKPQNPYILSNN